MKRNKAPSGKVFRSGLRVLFLRKVVKEDLSEEVLFEQ